MPQQYDRQLIITIHSAEERLVRTLAQKWNDKNSQACDIIAFEFNDKCDPIELSELDKQKLSQLSGKSRVYVCGHGQVDLPALIKEQLNSKTKKIETIGVLTARKLAKLFSEHIDKSNVNGLKISLLSCCSASSNFKDNVDNSFASKFHESLKDFGVINIQLFARNADVFTARNEFTGKMIKYSGGSEEEKLFDKHLTTIARLHFWKIDAKDNEDKIKREVLEEKLYTQSYNEMTLALKIKNRTRPDVKFLFMWQDNQRIKVDAYSASKAISSTQLNNTHRRNFMKSYQKEFIKFLISRGVLKFGEFKLKSGRISPYFFNAGMLNDGDAFYKIGMVYADTINDNFKDEYDVIFGPAYKGIPLSTAASIGLKMRYDQNVPVSFNRKEVKDHGEGGQMIGAPLEGKRVLLIDDVITAGTTVRESLEIIKNSKAELMGVVIALDRQEKGLKSDLSAIQEVQEEFGVRVVSIITLDNIIEYLKEEIQTTPLADHLTKIMAYKEKYGAQELPELASNYQV